jgi:hypothetical protein
MLAFFDGPGWDEGGAVLDGVAQLEPCSAFHFLMASCEASEPGIGRGAYGTPIYSKTQFKRSPFGIFTAMRASYSFRSKLPKTLSTSVSTSAKTC